MNPTIDKILRVFFLCVKTFTSPGRMLPFKCHHLVRMTRLRPIFYMAQKEILLGGEGVLIFLGRPPAHHLFRNVTQAVTWRDVNYGNIGFLAWVCGTPAARMIVLHVHCRDAFICSILRIHKHSSRYDQYFQTCWRQNLAINKIGATLILF